MALAESVVELETERGIKAGTDVRLGNRFADRQIIGAGPAELFDLRISNEPTRLFRLSNVALDASLAAFYSGRFPIPETLYMVADNDFDYALIKSREPVPTDPDEHYVLGCNRAHHNYYHWMIQSLPAIDWGLRKRKQPRVTLVLPKLQPWQEETLALLGHGNAPRLTLESSWHYAMASAEYSDFLGGRLPGIISYAAASTWERMRAAVPPADGAREIYIARTDATRRRMINEDALIAMLERRGVRIVVPGQHSVAQQIAMFRRARLVIGPHGAGLTNIAFCEAGSHVYELLSSYYPNIAFNRIAQSVALKYWADLFPNEGHGPRHDHEWSVDLNLVSARLDEIRTCIAATTPPENAMEYLRQQAAAAPVRHAENPPPRRGWLRRIFGRGG